MNKLKDKLIRFMYGRYGVDKLYYGLLALSGVLILANSFVKSPILYLLGWFVLGIMIFRTFSKNIIRRQIENQKFLTFWNKLKSKFLVTGNRVKEIKTHRYRKCPHCRAMLRLPRRTGKHVVSCPRCRKDFNVHVMF